MIREANLGDLDRLVEIERISFDSDRLSRRSFRHMLTKGHGTILVYEVDGSLVGYVMLLFREGTSLARLYSIAVLMAHRKSGVARQLVEAAELFAQKEEVVSIRLEIRVDNHASLRLFESMGYQPFGRYLKYYEDDADAVRLEKRIISHLPASFTRVPYYQQTLDFTCGPASLMMAMKTLDDEMELSRHLELRLWRESTTIYMTSGLGGCGPYGMALAAHHRGYRVCVYVNEGENILVDSVRSEEKKEVMRLVEEDFLNEMDQLDIPIHYQRLSIEAMLAALDDGGVPVILISSYRIYKEKFPHWVVVTGYDERFIYFHDPYIDTEKERTVTDCLNMPIAKKDFERMSRYGKSGQRAALVLYR